MDEWAQVWVYDERLNSPLLIQDADGTIEPEEWVREHGRENFPNAIYFFATLEVSNG